METKDKIQLVIAISMICSVLVMLLSVIALLWNVCEQKKYYENDTRPWAYPELTGNVTITETENKIDTHGYLHNDGRTPAKEFYIYSTLTKNKDYPTELIKNKTKGFEGYKKAIIFPNQKPAKFTNPTFYELTTNNLDNNIINILTLTDVYLHIYTTYLSENDKRYYLKQTFQMIYIKDIKNGLFVDWNYISSDTKPL